MRVPLADLREIRADVGAYRARMAAATTQQYFGVSKFRALTYAVCRYHAPGGDLAGATRYLEERYRKRFTRVSLDILQDQLAEYTREFRATGNTAIKSLLKVCIGLTDEFELRGEVGRLDITPSDRYAAWLLVKEAGDWRSDPRMPLLQGHFADVWDISPAQVTVGVYDFSLARHQAVSFSRAQIERARSETLALVRQLL